MKTFTSAIVLAASLGTLSGCVVAPTRTTGSVTQTQDGITTTTVTTVSPPPLPLHEQPVAPGPGYLWTPGYWAWGDEAYYWVPGVWVRPPRVGVLWTPGWWGWSSGIYHWHAGYWGESIGFYGGINYGYGYFGSGYVGGQWRGDQFYYNRTVNNIHDSRITNVYVDKHVVNNTTINRVSYNGGSEGTRAQPSAAEKVALQQPRLPPTWEQERQHRLATHESGQRYQPSGAGPAVFGTSRVGEAWGGATAATYPQAHPAAAPEREAMPAHEATVSAPREHLQAHGELERKEMQREPAPRENVPHREVQREAPQARESAHLERTGPARAPVHGRQRHERERERD
ncbi:YXWGXW repeat-containing protein [Comamonas sp. NLF-1-9]|uniref:YXWGXW repeat-containing protein n=1 Tax=Comamonas sp. NLF-1-9 TaxID=2853163 RepID=UPI001C48F006|nr:YXWGXW repeat-containing protein [Comamonas sp. NLF-1-9]QXL83228.1 YXWGXW repeat-containing protein [Comamonas sp. NLF-1-9]